MYLKIRQIKIDFGLITLKLKLKTSKDENRSNFHKRISISCLCLYKHLYVRIDDHKQNDRKS